MEDFNLVIKELISKDIEDIKIEVPESIKEEFDATADNYIKVGNLLDAIKVFAITNHTPRSIETGNLSIKEKKPYEALYGFYYANDPISLNKVGFELLNIPDVGAALKAFKRANNLEMIEFLVKNF